MNSKIKFIPILFILLASIILAFMYNYFSADGIPFIREPLVVKSVEIVSNNDSSNELKGLSLDQVIGLYNQKAAVFIDARDQWDFSDNHIVGAVNIPEFSFTSDNKTLSTIDKESLIIVYCDGDDCDTSKRLVTELLDVGYKNVYVFLGGFTEWSEANLPVENGSK